MRRTALILFCLLAYTWLGYVSFPGHTYLQQDTQIYLPILERLETPGFLSRDLVATRPHVSFTIYDEVALLLRDLGTGSFEQVLLGQQLLFRFCGLIGVYLLARAAAFTSSEALAATGLVHLGASLIGPAVATVELEPVPRGYAFGLILLALGLLARGRSVLAALTAGLAFLFHPPSTLPFWLVTLAAVPFVRTLRHKWQPLPVTLLIATLLLGNLAQLQPGVVEPQPIFGRVSARLAALQQIRTSYSWVSLWAPALLWHYVFIWIAGLWATARIWPRLDAALRISFVALPVVGLLSVPTSYMLLEKLRWALIPELQPARALLYTVAVAQLAAVLAAIQAGQARQWLETGLWVLFVLAVPIDIRILDNWQWWPAPLGQTRIFWIGLSAAGAALLLRSGRERPVLLALFPAAAAVLFPTLLGVQAHPQYDYRPVDQLAEWADKNTWGSSMFLFPDAGRTPFPGYFRARSRRALWVDWKSGGQANYFESLGDEWWQRWQASMAGPFTPKRLERLLAQPIDYFVLKRSDALSGVKPVFENVAFAVYDARDLRHGWQAKPSR